MRNRHSPPEEHEQREYRDDPAMLVLWVVPTRTGVHQARPVAVHQQAGERHDRDPRHPLVGRPQVGRKRSSATKAALEKTLVGIDRGGRRSGGQRDARGRLTASGEGPAIHRHDGRRKSHTVDASGPRPLKSYTGRKRISCGMLKKYCSKSIREPDEMPPCLQDRPPTDDLSRHHWNNGGNLRA